MVSFIDRRKTHDVSQALRCEWQQPNCGQCPGDPGSTVLGWRREGSPPHRRYVPHPQGSILGSLSQHLLTGTRHCHFMGGGASTLLVTMLLRVIASPETRRWLGWGDGVCRTEALSQELAEKVLLWKLFLGKEESRQTLKETG